MTTTISNPPQLHCQDCHAPLPASAFMWLGTKWIQCGSECSACEEKAAHKAILAAQARADAHYRENIPKKYRRVDQGGETTTTHPDWITNRCPIQLAHLQNWNPDKQPWVGLVGGAGKGKSRCMAVHAHRLARSGRRLLWVKAGALAWLHGVRYADKNGGGRDAWKTLHEIQTADVLIIDDIWKGITVQYLQTLFHILEDRLCESKTIMWSANTHPDDLQSIVKEPIPTDILEPLISRLVGSTSILTLSPEH